MTPIHAVLRLASVSAFAFCLIAGTIPDAADAQTAPKPFEPSYGQEGKDVIWVPTAQALVDRMLDMAKVTKDDYLVDLGSGDGRTVITAGKRGVKALGIEYNPNMVELSRQTAEKEGVGSVVQFIQGDIFESDFSQATVVTLFLLPDLNLRLRPTILKMKPGTRVVSNSFDMRDWTADEQIEAPTTDCKTYCRAFLWIVPAQVAGTWRLPQGQLTLNQTFQMLTGSLTLGGTTTAITDGRVKGDSVSFTAAGRTYNGRLNGTTIEFSGDTPAGQPLGAATRNAG